MLRPSMLFGVAVLTASACGPTPIVDPLVAPAASISLTATTGEPEMARARWLYHPAEMSESVDGLPLSDGSWLLAGELGERWMTEPLPRQTMEGEKVDGGPYYARATAHRAPERLDRIVRWSAQRWLFVGESGTTYHAKSALGPLISSTAPPVKLHRVAGSSKGLVGVDSLGQFYRYDGTTWHTPPKPDSGCATGTDCRRVFDLAATDSGHLLALAIPEKLWSSEDGGQSWNERAFDPFGAARLLRSVKGDVLIEGPHETKQWSETSNGMVVSNALERRLPTNGHLTLLPRRGPSSAAIGESRAVLTGARYYEVFADPEGKYLGDRSDQSTNKGETGSPARGSRATAQSMPWMLASGRTDAPLSVRRLDLNTPARAVKGKRPPAEKVARCEALRLAAHDGIVLIACMYEQGESVIIDLYRSMDAGKRFAKVTTLRAPDDDVSLAVGADGRAMITGACLDQPSTRSGTRRSVGDESCEPRAPIRLPANNGGNPSKSIVGDLTDRPTTVTWSLDGERAYFFGRRAKDERIALFVSRDGGKTFSSRPLVPPKGVVGRWNNERDEPRTIHPGAEGELGLVLGSHPPAYAVADPDGRITAVARLPDGVTRVSGHGRFIFALGPNQMHEEEPLSLGAWESADAGLSFRRVPLPMTLLVDEFHEPLATRCASGGCVISGRMTRIGWNQPEPTGQVVLAPHRGSQGSLQPAVQTPIACTLDAGRSWITVGSVHEPVLPSAFQTMRGTSIWSSLRHDDATGEVTALTVSVGTKSHRPTSQPLLAKVRDRGRYGSYVSRQMEGYAAARVALPRDRQDIPNHPIKLDVAWANYQTNTKGRATLDQLGALSIEDVTPGSRPHLVAGLLSVSPKGLFVRPSTTRKQTVVIDLTGKIIHQAPYPDWPAINATMVHSDAVLVGTTPLAVGMVAPGEGSVDATVALAELGGGSGGASFFRIAPPSTFGRFVGTWWTYHDDRVGLVTHVIDVVSSKGYATFTPFTASGQLGAPIPVPTQLDLPSAPTHCTEVQRRGTPRVNAPFAPGTRHPVLVKTSAEDLVLLTERAILHGTPDAPCVAAFHARQLRHPDRHVVAIITGDLKRAWLFRETPSQNHSFDYRPMRCELSPGATIPIGVWHEPGMVRR